MSRRRIDQIWHLQHPADFIYASLTGIVRGGALLAGQAPEALAAIKTAAAQRMEIGFRNAGSYAVLMAALIGVGTKP